MYDAQLHSNTSMVQGSEAEIKTTIRPGKNSDHKPIRRSEKTVIEYRTVSRQGGKREQQKKPTRTNNPTSQSPQVGQTIGVIHRLMVRQLGNKLHDPGFRFWQNLNFNG